MQKCKQRTQKVLEKRNIAQCRARNEQHMAGVGTGRQLKSNKRETFRMKVLKYCLMNYVIAFRSFDGAM